jgi:hypothetical protein
MKIIYMNKKYNVYKEFSNNNEEIVFEAELLSTILYDENYELKESIDGLYNEYVVNTKTKKEKE